MHPSGPSTSTSGKDLLHTIVVSSLVLVTAVGLCLTAVALLVEVQPLRIGSMHVTIRNPARPFFVAVVAAALLAYLRPGAIGRIGDGAARVMRPVPYWVPIGALATVVLITGYRYGSFVASAADSYGYITQAEMLAEGRLQRPESPLVTTATWTHARQSLAPLGWTPAAGDGLVPVYPPGYPLIMATVAPLHPAAMSWVVPLAGMLTIVALAVIGARVGGRSLGLAAAVLLATSPVFLLSLVVPMSDVVATAAWTGAVALALAPGLLAAACGGAAAGLALLVRPNLVPLAAGFVVLVFAATRGTTGAAVRRAVLASMGVALGALAVGWFHWQYYGTPFRSGYGSLSDLFALAHAPVNVTQFAAWLTSTHPLLVLVAAGAGMWHAAVRPAFLPRTFVLFTVLVLACYLFYLPFDNWSFLRFLLPAFPLGMLFSAGGMRSLSRWFNDDVRPVVFVGGVVWCALLQFHEARVRHVFVNAESVARFERISRDLGTTLPDSAVVLTREFSGSLHYYAGIQTVRWDWLDDDAIGGVRRDLEARGRPLFVLLHARDEEPAFRDRFGTGSLPLDLVQSIDANPERLNLYRVRSTTH